MKYLTISLTAVIMLSIFGQNVFAGEVNTLEKVRKSLWIKGIRTDKKGITMTYANNELGDSFEAPVSSSTIFDENTNEEEGGDNTELPEELFVPLQDV
jgi:5-methylthioribose kinase